MLPLKLLSVLHTITIYLVELTYNMADKCVCNITTGKR